MLRLNKEDNWVIESNKGWFNVKITDIWAYKDLMKLLVKRDFVTYYKQTILGPIWFLLQPLLTTVVFTFVFGKIGGLKSDGIPRPLFYMSGITAWNYFSDCLIKSSSVFKDNTGIFSKVYFPRIIIPLSIVLSNLIKFGVQFLLLILMIVYYLYNDSNFILNGKYLLLLPLLICIMAFLGLGFGMFISALTTKYRDLSFVVSFGVQLLMFTTTVAFPLSSVHHHYHLLVSLNPATPVLEAFRYILFGRADFNWISLTYSFVVSVLVFFIGILAFNKVEQSFVDTI